MQVTGAQHLTTMVPAKTGSHATAAPGFQDAVSAAMGGISQPAPTREESLRQIAETYDPRYMSFLERRAMMRTLADLGLATGAAASVAGFHPSLAINPRAEGNEGKSRDELVAEAEARAQQNPWMHYKQNYLAITQYTVSLHEAPVNREMLDLMWEICQIRDTDPVLSQSKAPPLFGHQDVMFTLGKGLDADMFGDGQAGAQDADLTIDFTTMALRLTGYSEDEEDEDKKAEENKARLEAEAAAAGEQAAVSAETIPPAETEAEPKRNRFEAVEAAQIHATQAWFDHLPKYV